MKLTIDRKSLVNALAIVKPAAASNKSSLPILANVEINAFEKSVNFTCSNLDQVLRTKSEAAIQTPGKTTVRAALLHDLAKSFAGAEVELQRHAAKLTVRCGQSHFELGVLDPEEFPAVPRLKDAVEVTLAQSTLREALKSTEFATSTDASRYVLNGSFVQLNGALTVATTDGRRLAERTMELPDKASASQAIIPRAAVAELLRLLGTNEDRRVTVQLCSNLAQFNLDGETTLITRLIEGNFPNYRQIIPDVTALAGVPISRTDLLSALHRIAFISDEAELEFERQLLTIRGKGRQDVIGQAEESLMIPKCEPLKARFNIHYLIEGLNAVEDDEVLFFGQQDTHLSVIKVASKPWLCVIAGLASEEKKTEKADSK